MKENKEKEKSGVEQIYRKNTVKKSNGSRAATEMLEFSRACINVERSYSRISF